MQILQCILKGSAPNILYIRTYVMIHIMIYTVTAGDFFEVDGMLIGDKARGLGGADEDTFCLLAGEDDDGAGSICFFDGWILTTATARFFSSFSCEV